MPSSSSEVGEPRRRNASRTALIRAPRSIGKIQELRAELTADKRDSKHAKKRVALKKVVANMTMGNDMSPLFSDVVACMQIPILEIKKMVYLFLIHYSKSKPDLAALAINSFIKVSPELAPCFRFPWTRL